MSGVGRLLRCSAGGAGPCVLWYRSKGGDGAGRIEVRTASSIEGSMPSARTPDHGSGASNPDGDDVSFPVRAVGCELDPVPRGGSGDFCARREKRWGCIAEVTSPHGQPRTIAPIYETLLTVQDDRRKLLGGCRHRAWAKGLYATTVLFGKHLAPSQGAA